MNKTTKYILAVSILLSPAASRAFTLESTTPINNDYNGSFGLQNDYQFHLDGSTSPNVTPGTLPYSGTFSLANGYSFDLMAPDLSYIQPNPERNYTPEQRSLFNSFGIHSPHQVNENIYASTFGGKGDKNQSAYLPNVYVDPSKVGAALPYKFRQGDSIFLVTIEISLPYGQWLKVPVYDVGPRGAASVGNGTNDPYFRNGDRPAVESIIKPGGNSAGIDLTPATMDLIHKAYREAGLPSPISGGITKGGLDMRSIVTNRKPDGTVVGGGISFRFKEIVRLKNKSQILAACE